MIPRPAKANADRLAALINDLLDLSRIDRGREDLLEIQPWGFDISLVIQNCLGNMNESVFQGCLIRDLRFGYDSDGHPDARDQRNRGSCRVKTHLQQLPILMVSASTI